MFFVKPYTVCLIFEWWNFPWYKFKTCCPVYNLLCESASRLMLQEVWCKLQCFWS